MTTALQTHIIETLNVKPAIDVKQEIRERVDFLKNFLITSNANGYVLGISGGQDSTLAGKLAAIACKELQQENGTKGQPTAHPKFYTVRLPYGTQRDEDDAQAALEFIEPDESITYNIKEAVDGFKAAYNLEVNGTPAELTDYAKGNVKARTRMIAQYAYASELGLIVIGTDHAAEAVTGFFTKFGDGGADVLPLSGLTKRQGKALLRELGAPEHLYTKAPTADLLDNVAGQPDETELGITYDQLDDYLEGQDVPEEVSQKVEVRYLATEHKRQAPITPADTWWIR